MNRRISLYVVVLAVVFAVHPAFAAPLPACAGPVEAASVQVVRVEKNGALILDDGRAVHVEGLLLPAGARDRGPDFLPSQALNELSPLTQGGGPPLPHTRPTRA